MGYTADTTRNTAIILQLNVTYLEYPPRPTYLPMIGRLREDNTDASKCQVHKYYLYTGYIFLYYAVMDGIAY